MYDELLALPLPMNVRTVFTTLQAASRDQHLPAFQACFEEETAALLEAMGTSITDEYHAQATYGMVLLDVGDITPFSNIVLAEGRHVEAVAGLFLKRDFPVPEDPWNEDNIDRYTTRLEACEGGVAAELENIAMYDELLALDLPLDVVSVFTTLQAASLEQHLPAFQTCVEEETNPPEPPAVLDAMGTAIQAEYLAQTTYNGVLSELGSITPFAQIVLGEGNHVDAVAGLFTKRELPVPASDWSPDDVPEFGSRLAACEAAVLSETAMVGMYDGFLATELPDDVTAVFTNLRASAQDQHLPAFQACVEDENNEPPEPPAFLGAMATALQDELRAMITYQQVLADINSNVPFNSLYLAESEHVSAVTGLFTNRGLPVPESEWTADNVPRFDTRLEACQASVLTETATVQMYDAFLLLELPNDVATVFTNLRFASQEQHLPALLKCS